MVTREVFDNGLCLLTEAMPDVRSVSLGVWLTRGSRHEGRAHCGIAHFAEHMLFKGTTNRTAEAIAQEVDSIGGQLDAFTAKEFASYHIKVLDDHLPKAVDLLSDLVTRPAFREDDIDREKKVILEEIKMVEDMPDDLVHELFTETFWPNHPLGRSILGSPASVTGITAASLRGYFDRAYVGQNFVVAAAGHIDHPAVRDLIARAFAAVPSSGDALHASPPQPATHIQLREKDIEQAHVCLGMPGYPQGHADRYATYVLNTVLGGSMSSRLFQNIREKRGLAYAVSSSLESYRDAGAVTVYAGCDATAVPEVIELVVAELRGFRRAPLRSDELTRAKDHLKGNLVLGLESTTSRMSQLARSEMYFGRQIALAEHLDQIDRVSAEDVQRVAADLFCDGVMGATVLGPLNGMTVSPAQLDLG